MFGSTSLMAALHEATHKIPGVPAHVDQPPGHRRHRRRDAGRAVNGRWNHSTARPPRILVGWQRRIAALVGQQLP